MTELTGREFLRLHIESCWGITIPPIEHASVDLLATAPVLPPWSVYQAALSKELVTVWRPDVSPEQRADLLQRARSAGMIYDPTLGMRREVVLRLSTTLPETNAPLQYPACLLTAADEALLEVFEAGSAAYFLNPRCAPCMGVVVEGRLVSVAHSSRRTAAACALGINTIPEARRQGYATIAVQAWTQAILREGLTPIYSAFAYNTASLRLAAATGYVPVSESVYGPIAAAAE